jgi:hypothetical protein
VACTDVLVHPETPGSDLFPITAILELKSASRSPTGVMPLAVAPGGADADVGGPGPKSER